MYTVAPAERMIFLCAAFPAEQSSPCSPWLGLHAAMFLMLQKTSRELRASFPERSHLLPPGKGQQWRQAAVEHSPVLEWQITLDRCAASTKQKEQERRRENSWKWQELGSGRNLHSKLTAKNVVIPGNLCKSPCYCYLSALEVVCQTSFPAGMMLFIGLFYFVFSSAPMLSVCLKQCAGARLASIQLWPG